MAGLGGTKPPCPGGGASVGLGAAAPAASPLPLQPPPAWLSKLSLMWGEDNSDLPLRAVKD